MIRHARRAMGSLASLGGIGSPSVTHAPILPSPPPSIAPSTSSLLVGSFPHNMNIQEYRKMYSNAPIIGTVVEDGLLKREMRAVSLPDNMTASPFHATSDSFPHMDDSHLHHLLSRPPTSSSAVLAMVTPDFREWETFMPRLANALNVTHVAAAVAPQGHVMVNDSRIERGAVGVVLSTKDSSPLSLKDTATVTRSILGDLLLFRLTNSLASQLFKVSLSDEEVDKRVKDVSFPSMQSSISLFPQHDILLPGGKAECMIYEPRHSYMLKEYFEAGKPFGFVSGNVVAGLGERVGTMARVTSIGARSEIGQWKVTVEGTGRFKVVETRVVPNSFGLIESTVEPYVDVPLSDSEKGEADRLLKEAVSLIDRMVKEDVVRRLEASIGPQPKDPAAASFWLGAALNNSSEKSEEWLRQTSAVERLRSQLDHIKLFRAVLIQAGM